jgi:hypothetical protein
MLSFFSATARTATPRHPSQVIESVAESLDLASGFDEQKVAADLASLDALWDSHADTGES